MGLIEPVDQLTPPYLTQLTPQQPYNYCKMQNFVTFQGSKLSVTLISAIFMYLTA